MTVADVPVTELAGLRCRGQDLIPSGDLSTHGSPTALLLVDEFGVIGKDQGQVGLSGFVHVTSMHRIGEESKGPGPGPQLSHPVEHVSDCLTILFLSLKGPTVDSLRELTHLGRGGHVVPTLGVDLGDVGVGSGFVHAVIIGTAWGDLWSLVDSAPTGSAAAAFVQLWVV